MLLDYFALWYRSYTSGSAGSKGVARPVSIVVVEYAGKEYRVPIGEVHSFLARLAEPPEVRKVFKKRVRKNKKSQYRPVVKVVYAPEEEIEQVNAAIDRSNEKLQYVWNKLLQDLYDDEAILLLVMT